MFVCNLTTTNAPEHKGFKGRVADPFRATPKSSCTLDRKDHLELAADFLQAALKGDLALDLLLQAIKEVPNDDALPQD